MRLLQVVVAGIFGGFVNSLGIWGLGALGVNAAMGFNFAPTLSLPWLMPRLISSGLWGLLFLLPFWHDNLIRKGVVLSGAPFLMMLFIIFPKMGGGMLGLDLGSTAPLFALFFSVVWGVTAGLYLKIFKKQMVA